MLDWLNDWWNDVTDWVEGIWNDFTEFLGDLPVEIFEDFLDGILYVLGTIPIPAFIQGGFSQYLNAIDPSVMYFVSRSGLAEALSLLGAGFAFRMLRKIFTLGLW